jgi:hypothetical protein
LWNAISSCRARIRCFSKSCFVSGGRGLPNIGLPPEAGEPPPDVGEPPPDAGEPPPEGEPPAEGLLGEFDPGEWGAGLCWPALLEGLVGRLGGRGPPRVFPLFGPCGLPLATETGALGAGGRGPVGGWPAFGDLVPAGGFAGAELGDGVEVGWPVPCDSRDFV